MVVVARLLPVFGSAVELVTDALFTSVAEVGRTFTVTVSVRTGSATATVPRFQVIVPLTTVNVPTLAVADTYCAPAGRVSVTTTFEAEDGPRLSTLTT